MIQKRLLELFEEPEIVSEFEDELQAVAEGSKAISVTDCVLEDLQRGDTSAEPEVSSGYSELVDRCWDLGLSILHVPAKMEKVDCNRLLLFIVKGSSELWRVAPYLTLKKSRPWSFALEAVESSLLGYSEASTRAWLKYLKHISIGFGLATVYVLMSESQKVWIDASGRRRVPEHPTSELTVFLTRRDLGPRRDFVELSEGWNLGRVGVSHSDVPPLFGKEAVLNATERGIEVLQFNQSSLVRLNAVIKTNIEIWNGIEWT